jgi:Cu-Zn family superoxide dismutase
MKLKILVPAGLAVAMSGCMMDGAGTQSASGVRAEPSRAQLIGADGRPRGTVRIIQVHGGVSVSVEAENLPPGVHGAHVHAVGRCDAPGFTSAGPHWNPTGRQHGRSNPAGAHMGDVPNITIGANGRGSLEYEIRNAWAVRGATPMLDADGAAFVIHAKADDDRTDPSGNSGDRIACAVLRYPPPGNRPG